MRIEEGKGGKIRRGELVNWVCDGEAPKEKPVAEKRYGERDGECDGECDGEAE